MSKADDELLPELDLRLTEENLEDLYEHAPCGYCSCLPDGTLVKLNHTLLQWLGYSRQEVVARYTLQELLTAEGRQNYETHCLPLLLQHGQLKEISNTLQLKDGATLPVLLNAVLLHDATGQPLVVRVTLFDITGRHQYEQELLRARAQAEEQAEQLRAQNEQLTRINADLDNFVYTASHDLKQPVHNMAGLFEEFKRSTTFHDPAAAHMAAMFTEALHQILTTIDGLTEIVQEERKLEQAPVEAVELQPFTEEIIRSLLPRREQAEARFSLNFVAVPALRIARHSLHSMLYNLLNNALLYTEPGRPPHITVNTTQQNGMVVLSVQDNGRGIDLKRYRGKMFQLFRRFHPEVAGTGMGLYLVNRLVYQAGGRIEVESEVGQGTTFRLYLPR
ncbi:PAS domain-containing sensor histidine kinase [Hymenobacter sp. BT730]|uniref:PAS domain-containing sensor histidine kinase n=1 Tax=Hymenobacter sp. BT730 TaxID=3063332 RepID=UPI0026E07B81|nr:PAS domain-containing sensor histidine kinase [Hymenobacter sp. BT730]